MITARLRQNLKDLSIGNYSLNLMSDCPLFHWHIGIGMDGFQNSNQSKISLLSS